MAEHPQSGGKQKHEVTVEDVVRYELECNRSVNDLVPHIRRTYGMFSNISQSRIDEALSRIQGPTGTTIDMNALEQELAALDMSIRFHLDRGEADRIRAREALDFPDESLTTFELWTTHFVVFRAGPRED